MINWYILLVSIYSLLAIPIPYWRGRARGRPRLVCGALSEGPPEAPPAPLRPFVDSPPAPLGTAPRTPHMGGGHGPAPWHGHMQMGIGICKH